MSIKYFAYGDESISNNIVLYSIFACPQAVITEAIEILKIVKINFKGRGDFNLHGRILFNEHQKIKNNCTFLSNEDVFNIYSQLFDRLAKPPFKKIIVMADKIKFPKVIACNPIVPFLVIQDKTLVSFCANIALLPFFHTFGNLNCIKFFADQDKTKIDWLGRKSQLINTLNIFMSKDGISRKEVSNCRVKPEPYDRKPELLEIADGIAYFSAKALSLQVLKDRVKINSIFEKINPLQLTLTQNPFDGGLTVNIDNELTKAYIGY